MQAGNQVIFKDVDLSTGRKQLAVAARSLTREGALAAFAVRLPGRKYWSSRFNQGYAPAETKVLVVLEDLGPSPTAVSGSGLTKGREYRVDELLEVPVRVAARAGAEPEAEP